jgi:L-glyceraldehyde 3-phosphate reductase
VAQLEDNLGALANLHFDGGELAEIDRSATEAEINIWSTSSDA